MSVSRLPAIGLCLFVLSGCATIPAPLQGDYATSRPENAPATAQKVRWGGQIIRVDNDPQRSCFEVLARPLDSRARPLQRDSSEGRFLACRAGFYDPAVFEAGRNITVAGTVEGSELRKVGDYEYRYPRIAADVIYLWSEQTYARDPWVYGRDPFWYRPFGPPVIVVRSHR